MLRGLREIRFFSVGLLVFFSSCISPETRQKILTNAEAIRACEGQIQDLLGKEDPASLALRQELAAKLQVLQEERLSLERQAAHEREESGREAGATTIEIIGWILGALATATGGGAVAYKIGPTLAAKIAAAIRQKPAGGQS